MDRQDPEKHIQCKVINIIYHKKSQSQILYRMNKI